MPVEGGARVAIIEGADRMNEDAQSALLKTLEEPPAGVTIVLCADQEARLLPTVRSRCFRVRLGLGRRARHRGDPRRPRPGRPADRRPGSAGSPAGGPAWRIAYARAPEAVLIRAELTRVLLDLTDAGPARRLAACARPSRARWRWRPRSMPAWPAPRRRATATAAPRRRAARGRGGGGAGADRDRRPGRRRRRRADGRRADAADADDGRGRPARPATERRRGVEIAARPVDRRRARPRPDRVTAASAPSTTRSSSRSWPRSPPPSIRRRRRRVPRAGRAVRRTAGRRTSRPSSSSTRWCSPGRAAARPPERRSCAERADPRSMPPSSAASRASASATSPCARRWISGSMAGSPTSADGSVRCVAEGPRDQLEASSSVLRDGSGRRDRGARQRGLDAGRPARSDRSRCAAAPTAGD